ncbi:MAG: glycosyltransferase [Pseudomonadota bacterium]
MRILALGSDNFVKPLRTLGHEVHTTAGLGDAAARAAAQGDPEWPGLEVAARARGLKFDAILVTDDVGRRTLPTGLWAVDAVTIFYGVDAPLNGFWQLPYARLFDLAFLDQPRQAQELATVHAGAAWLPVGVEADLYLGREREESMAGVGFVGVVDESLRPKRSAVLHKVSNISPLTVRGGRREHWFDTARAAELYRSCPVVLNENLFPGVTTRPLEVMAAGGCLLSEAAPGSMDRLFQDGEHLVFFGPDNLEHKLKELLGDPALRRRLAQAGQAEVRQNHDLSRRAEEIIKRIEGILVRGHKERPRARGGEALRLEGEALLWAGLRWPGQGGAQRLARAAGRLQAAANNGAERLASYRSAGRALLALGNHYGALHYLSLAGEAGGPVDALAWALAAWQAGKAGLARETLAGAGQPGGLPGQAGFHVAAARLLGQAGQDLSAGFNRRGLDMALWTGLEHLLEATALEPGEAGAWEDMGDLLMARGAPNQAHHCLGRAQALAGGERLAAKLAQSAREGYLA